MGAFWITFGKKTSQEGRLHATLTLCKKSEFLSVNFSWNLRNLILVPFWISSGPKTPENFFFQTVWLRHFLSWHSNFEQKVSKFLRTIPENSEQIDKRTKVISYDRYFVGRKMAAWETILLSETMESAKKEKLIDVVQIVLTKYNKFIGGVDLLDSLAYLHRIPLRSKQHRVIWNLFRKRLVLGIGRKGFNQHATMNETPNMM